MFFMCGGFKIRRRKACQFDSGSGHQRHSTLSRGMNTRPPGQFRSDFQPVPHLNFQDNSPARAKKRNSILLAFHSPSDCVK